MDDERQDSGSPVAEDPRHLVYDCMMLFGQLEELISQRGGEGKGMGEKVHSLRSGLPESLFSELLSVVNIRNKISHQIHKQVFTVAQLRETLQTCHAIRDQLIALPTSYARPMVPFHSRGLGGFRRAPFHRPPLFKPVGGVRFPSPEPKPLGLGRPIGIVVALVAIFLFSRGTCSNPPSMRSTSSAATMPERPLIPESSYVQQPPARNPSPAAKPSKAAAATQAKRPARPGKRAGKADDDSWNDLVDTVESQRTPPAARPGRTRAKSDPSPEEIDAVLGQ